MTVPTLTSPRPGPLTRPAPRSPHPTWCARGHRCGLGEHRSDPIRVSLPRVGSLVLTRVQATGGRQYAEIRASLRLGEDETQARARLSGLLDDLTHLMRPTHTGHARNA